MDHVGVLQKENGTEQEEEKEGDEQELEEGGEDEDESTADCTEMKTCQMNGGAEPVTSLKTPSKSPSANRTGRKNQVF